MKLVTVTSDNFVQVTMRMIESVRIWHRELPIVVYALDKGWTDAYTRLLDPLSVTIKSLTELDTRNRGGALHQAVQNLFKLDMFLDQTEPYVYLDSDILVLKPLDEVLERTQRDGWFCVHEGTGLAEYHVGELAAVAQLSGALPPRGSINTGVIGCAPAKHREMFDLARDWGGRITKNLSGDQGLINAAWWKLRGALPPDAGTRFNGGWLDGNRVRLTQTILHFARPGYPDPWRQSKEEDQAKVWAGWPRGVRLTNLTDTPWWRGSLPHPWPWLNQANRRRHRRFVAELRQRSLELMDIDYLLVEDPWQAYLLHPRLLRRLDAFWRQNAFRFKDLRHVPTYHLAGRGQVTSTLRRRIERWKMQALAIAR